MRIVAGCFGCLAFVFLALALAWGSILQVLLPMLPPDAQVQVAPFAGYVQYVNSGCCCMSGVLCIVLLVAGSMRSKEPIE